MWESRRRRFNNCNICWFFNIINSTCTAEISSNKSITIVISTGVWVGIIPLSACIIISVSNRVIVSAVIIDNSRWSLWFWSIWLFGTNTSAAKISSDESLGIVVSTGVWVGIIPLSAGIVVFITNGIIVSAAIVDNSSWLFSSWLFNNWLFNNWLFFYRGLSSNTGAAEIGSDESVSIIVTAGIWVSIIPLGACIIISVSDGIVIGAVIIDNSRRGLWFWSIWLSSSNTSAAKVSSNESLGIIVSAGIWVSVIPFRACVIVFISNGIIVGAAVIDNWFRCWLLNWCPCVFVTSNYDFTSSNTGAAKISSYKSISIIISTCVWVLIIPFSTSIIISITN
jgi:hypothetical protein